MGAAVAVAVGAGSVGLATASGPDHPAVVVSITPCRLFDTRPGAGHVEERDRAIGSEAGRHLVRRGRLTGGPVEARRHGPRAVAGVHGEEAVGGRIGHGDVHHEPDGVIRHDAVTD